jgi:hypothetical protein
VLGLVTVALTADPSGATLLAASAVLGSWALAARVPRSALPRVPRWFILALLGGGVLVAVGGGAPYLSVLGLTLAALDARSLKLEPSPHAVIRASAM